MAWAADPSPAKPGGPAKPPLPISEVALYSSGVGFFQRQGRLEGKSNVQFRFKTEDIDDLLKSMVVQDFDGGRVSMVTYESRDPATKTLKSFAIDLTEKPTMAQLLEQMRGEKVEVAWPNSVQGTILGVEVKTKIVDEKTKIDAEYLNLLAADGLQSIPMAQVQKIKLLNEALNQELRQALEVLATGHDNEKKAVGLMFDGEGSRRVSVSYIAAMPIWKTSYRLVLDGEKPAFLQGWAIVENTTDEDWNNIQLSLVSGRPISFTMNLYEPVYTERPEAQLELHSSLKPQVYNQEMEQLNRGEKAMPKNVTALNALPAPAMSMAMAPESAGRGGRMGVAGGRALLRDADAADFAAPAMSLDAGVRSAASGQQAGELFQYNIKSPVTLARQKTAMLPIVNDNVEGEKISIFNEKVEAKHPLNGFRIKNTSGLYLMQGPLTIFEGNTYAGDALIQDLAPGQDRLISYALDLKVEVDAQGKSEPQELTSAKLQRGLLVTTKKLQQSRTYTVRNRDQKKKSVIIEHPYRADWELVEPKGQTERTRDMHRIRAQVDADKSQKVVVKEQRQLVEQVQLLTFATDAFGFYIKSPQVSERVKAALRKIVAMRDANAETARQRGRLEQRINEITQEQSRIRENMSRLSQTSELYTRYVKIFDAQETELDKIRTQIEELKNKEAAQQTELTTFINGLDLE